VNRTSLSGGVQECWASRTWSVTGMVGTAEMGPGLYCGRQDVAVQDSSRYHRSTVRPVVLWHREYALWWVEGDRSLGLAEQVILDVQGPRQM